MDKSPLWWKVNETKRYGKQTSGQTNESVFGKWINKIVMSWSKSASVGNWKKASKIK